MSNVETFGYTRIFFNLNQFVIMSNNANESHEHLTVSKVYETLRSAKFLQKLYWEVLSDIKEKETYKQMRKTTERLLNQKIEVLSNLTYSQADNFLRQTTVAEVCSMTYAIDTVYSKILFLKIEREFETQVINQIIDLREKKKITDSVWAKLQISDDKEVNSTTENSTSKSNLLQRRPETSHRPVRMKRQKFTTTELATKNREIQSEIHEDLKAINSDDGKVAASSKYTSTRSQVRKKQTSLPVKKTRKKKQAEENQIPSTLKTATETVEGKVIPKEDMQFDNSESDAESEKSVGHLSLASISSVHTSDLSSYDDDISLSSEDGENGTKRKLSLKELNEMCNNGRFSSKFNGSFLKNVAGKESSEKSTPSAADKEKQLTPSAVKEKQITPSAVKEKQITPSAVKEKQNTPSAVKEKKFIPSAVKEKKITPSAVKEKQIESSPNKADSAQESTDSGMEAKSPTQKTLPRRIRKPNSKYSSDNILCTIRKVKERKKQTVEVRNEVKSSSDKKSSCDVKNSTESPQISRKRSKSDVSDSEAETPSKTMQIMIKEEYESESDFGSTSSQQTKLYKPHFAVRSLTSRKTAPVTLYST